MPSVDELQLRFSISLDRSLTHIENVTWPWPALVNRLSQFHVDPLPIEEFRALSKDKQSKRKSSHGYFVGAQFRGHARKKQFMQDRQLLTFDIDKGTPKLLQDLRNGTSGLGNIRSVVYSTHGHGGDVIKLRIVIPLAKRISHDRFQAISRVLAWYIDPKMLTVDNVSFTDNQLMYWPAHCSDVEPVFIHNEGPLIDIDAVLLDWTGPDDADRWKDMRLLPRSPREPDFHDGGGIAANPLTKRGIVGAYCREYDIHQCIATFLSDVYEVSEVGQDGVPLRYTYKPGTLSSGAVSYDEGRKLHSHHGSDPCSGLNVNSFDLRRIHEFGHLDKPEHVDKPPQEQASYLAMVEALRDDPGVQKELFSSNYGDMDDAAVDAALGEGLDGEDDLAGAGVAEDPLDATVPPAKPEDDGDWRERLDVNQHGIVKSNVANLVLILRHWPSFRGHLAYNQFTYRAVLAKSLRSKSLRFSFDGGPDTMLTDVHMGAIRIVLESPRGKGLPGWGLKVTDRDLIVAVGHVCAENAFHPVRDWLNGLTWDGVPRIDQFWVKTCHVANTEYHRQAASHWIMGAVARIMTPGCKFDFMPILQGPQGIMKSSLLQAFGGHGWVGEMDGHFEDKKKLVEATIGFMILEIPELSLFRRADVEAVKSMVTRTEETCRLSYRKNEESFPRQFTLCGTTNEDSFLRDDTGHRRYWTILCGPGQINLAWVLRWREQLWAEAYARWREMCLTADPMRLPLHLTGEAVGQSEEAQALHVVPDVAKSDAGVIEVWLETPVPFKLSRPGAVVSDEDDAFDLGADVLRDRTCGREIWVRALGGEAKFYDQRQAQRIGKAMKHVPGWGKGKNARCGEYGTQETYERTVASGL